MTKNLDTVCLSLTNAFPDADLKSLKKADIMKVANTLFDSQLMDIIQNHSVLGAQSSERKIVIARDLKSTLLDTDNVATQTSILQSTFGESLHPVVMTYLLELHNSRSDLLNMSESEWNQYATERVEDSSTEKDESSTEIDDSSTEEDDSSTEEDSIQMNIQDKKRELAKNANKIAEQIIRQQFTAPKRVNDSQRAIEANKELLKNIGRQIKEVDTTPDRERTIQYPQDSEISRFRFTTNPESNESAKYTDYRDVTEDYKGRPRVINNVEVVENMTRQAADSWKPLHRAFSSEPQYNRFQKHGGLDNYFSNMTEEAKQDQVRAVDARNMTALHFAAPYEDDLVKLVEILPENERLSAINQLDDAGRSVFHHAALNDDSLDYLLSLTPESERQGVLEQTDQNGQSVYHLAAENPDSLDLILAHTNEDDLSRILKQKDNMGQTVYHHAASNSDSISQLVEKAPEGNLMRIFNKQDNMGQTVYHHAAESYASLKYLLENTPMEQRLAAVTTLDNSGRSVLDYISSNTTRNKIMNMLSPNDKEIITKGTASTSSTSDTQSAQAKPTPLPVFQEPNRAAVQSGTLATTESMKSFEEKHQKSLDIIEKTKQETHDVPQQETHGPK